MSRKIFSDQKGFNWFSSKKRATTQQTLLLAVEISATLILILKCSRSTYVKASFVFSNLQVKFVIKAPSYVNAASLKPVRRWFSRILGCLGWENQKCFTSNVKEFFSRPSTTIKFNAFNRAYVKSDQLISSSNCFRFHSSINRRASLRWTSTCGLWAMSWRRSPELSSVKLTRFGPKP